MGCCSSSPPPVGDPQGVMPGEGFQGLRRDSTKPPPTMDPYDLTDVARLYESTKKMFQDKVDGGEAATAQSIGVLLRDTTTKAQAILTKASRPSVRVLCVEEYKSMGWDFNDNRAITTPPTTEQLVGCLTSLSTKIRQWVEVQHSLLEPSQQELDDLSQACDKLWQLDHRLNPEDGLYHLNLQGGKDVGNNKDLASEPLFTFVNQEVLRRPTFATFITLLKNYNHEIGQAEVVTPDKIAENHKFINTIYGTPCIQYLHHYLVAKNLAPVMPEPFKDMLYNIWFELYGRTRNVKDSSGFEHVFVGEYKDHKVVGCHSWVHLHLQEKAGKLNYKGYLRPKTKSGEALEHDEYEQLLSINFDWNGLTKDSSTIFIGTSPEFEVALYTLVLLVGNEDKVVVKLGPYRLEISCYKLDIQSSIRTPQRPSRQPSHNKPQPITSSTSTTSAVHAVLRGIHLRRIYDVE